MFAWLGGDTIGRTDTFEEKTESVFKVIEFRGVLGFKRIRER